MSNCWLMKSEPGAYSIDDLERDGSTCWDGVRNYQARNLMREMQQDDAVLFYHSNANPPSVVGIARVCREAYPDHTSWDPESRYFDPKSSPEEPRWWMVDIAFVEELPRPVPLSELKAEPTLEGMLVTGKSRLSVQPVDRRHFDRVVELARGEAS
ncbi:MAG: EVE domain-containing protein [marine benthic group bacterium]|jgi:predicted RNA-binding protein with PUA-like domain|nr:EVE domain-containing protein [Gemmatimonadota bacterium]MCL7981710.1 EVE domain-containing protein [Gemmatimonadota bacterium]